MAYLFNETKQCIIAHNLTEAATFFRRLRGLMFTSHLSDGHALIITPCTGIHTFFMRYPIDVLFLDKNLTVIRSYPSMKPYRLSSPAKKARHAVELPAGTMKKLFIEEGDQLKIEK